MAMLEATRAPIARAAYRPAGDGSRGSATLLTGCVMEGLFTETNRATERTLAANDYAVVPTSGQRCCGALHAHAGDLDAARSLARRNIAAFEASGDGLHRRERRGLRRDDEGIRATSSPTTPSGDTAPPRCRPACAT